MPGLKAALVDLSGTLHIGAEAIPGAQNALKRLREKVAVRFVTNTTKESRTTLIKQLQSMGFELNEFEVFSSPTAAVSLLKRHNLRPLLLIHPALFPDFQGIPKDDPNCVVIGLAPIDMTYHSLNHAFQLLMKTKGPIIALHKGRYFKAESGLSLGPGPFVTALEYATGIEATVVGKPSADFFRAALEDLNVLPGEAVMVGDDLRDDVVGAKAIGCKGLLVRTGKYLPEDETKALQQADGVLDDFPAAVEWILSHCDSTEREKESGS
mmetsp:Transcript_40952/g.68452  ORF Transcript_40952/g.68452 Transcript_40952/m.68452 type:complete len:267 (+) Transcript_40952:121-921(+)